MDFESPDVEKDFPGLYASESGRKSNESDLMVLIMKNQARKTYWVDVKKKKKEKKDRGYAALEGESSPEEDTDTKSPSKSKKTKSFKFPTKSKEKREKSRDKEKEKEEKAKFKLESKEKLKDEKKDKTKDKDKEKVKEKEKEKVKEKDKDKKDKKLTKVPSTFTLALPIFGVPLAQSVERSRCHDDTGLPLVVRDSIDYLQIYRTEPDKIKLQQLKKLFTDRGPTFPYHWDVPVACAMLKTFISELPDSILTQELHGQFEQATAIAEPQREATIYVPPLASIPPDFPETAPELSLELRKQESLLNQIHAEMHAGFITPARDQQLEAELPALTAICTTTNASRGTGHPQEPPEVKTPNEPFLDPKESPSQEPIFEAEFEDNFEFKPEIPIKETPEQELPPAEPIKEKPKLTEKELKVLRLELENAEYLQLKSLLQAKINSEQFEIVKLRSHVALKNKAEGAQTTKETKENNIQDEQELRQRLIKENALLEQKRINLINQIFQERVACIQLKIELAMKEILSKS
ncbi:hypothetical protein HF086_004296 [Spodoptera exigua]|uniref:Rho-GAP domain-containing protein n=1 Tax=Spodoptera exigua TaxID=7107 RepID=A0A922MV37_SPOEX|nr:hypothetical protein HF086_004296 [Spodoptera exigua]